MKCEICGRDRASDDGVVITLSAEEREFIAKSLKGSNPSSYFYCDPCYRVVTDREQGARLISGQLELQLRQSGHPKAREVADRFYKFLIEKSKDKQVS
jgi:uncharacterized protein YlaI